MSDILGRAEGYSVSVPSRNSDGLYLWGKLVDKSSSFGDMAACQDLPETDGPQKRLDWPAEMMLWLKSKRERTQKEEKTMRERGSLFPEICFLSKVKEKDKEKVTTQEREGEQKEKRKCRTTELTAEDCAIWILIGEGYLRPGIALVPWQQSQKGFSRPPESEPQLVAMLKTKTTVVFQPWFKSPSAWVSIDRKPNLPNCEWAAGIGLERQVWGET